MTRRRPTDTPTTTETRRSTPTAGKLSFAALVLVTGVGPFATDTYVAALPQVRAALATSPSVAQLTITTFIVGLALGQLFSGPVSDGRGRRRMVLTSTVVFTAASVLCALAPNGPVLVAVRLLQGIAAGTGIAVGRAVVSDRFEGDAAATAYGTLASITLLAPVLAPAVGGVLLSVADWRSVFVFLAVLGGAMTVAAAVGIPETLPPERRQPSGLRSLRARVVDLLADRAFAAPVVVQCLATAGFFTYIGGSSFVLQTQLGISPGRYSLVFATNAAAMMAASVVFRLTVVRVGAPLLRQVGLGLSTTAAVALLAVALAAGDGITLAPTWALLAVVVGGMGLTGSASTVLAQAAGRRSGGTAASLSGGLAFLVGALATPLTGLTGHQSVLAMASIMACLFVASLSAAVAFAAVGRRSVAAGRIPTSTR